MEEPNSQEKTVNSRATDPDLDLERELQLAHDLFMDSKRQKTEWDPMDCPLFRLYAEEPHLCSGNNFFE